MGGVDLRALLPLYLVIFIGFCGYSLMITLFVPMLMGTNGFLAADATAGQCGAWYSVSYWRSIRSASFSARLCWARYPIATVASLSLRSHYASRLPPTS